MSGNSSGIRAGRAYVEIGADAGPLDSVLRSTQNRILSFSSNIRKMGVQLMTLGLGMGAGLGYFVKEASNAEETWASFTAVFKGLTTEADSFAKSMADAIGRSPQELRIALMQFQALGKSLGYNEQAAYAMSKQLASAGIDLAAFWNVDESEMFQRLRSGITGSVEAMGNYGVEMHAGSIDTQLLAMGINKTTANATEQQKVMARLAIIIKSVNDIGAKGQALKETGSFANQWRRLKAEFQSTAIAVGKALLPAITKLAGGLSIAFNAIKKMVEVNPAAVVAFAQLTAGALGTGLALYSIGLVMPLVSTGISLVVGLLAAIMTPMGAIAAGLIGISAYFLLMTEDGQAAINGLTTDFNTLKENIIGIWGAISDAISAGDLGLAGQIAMSSLNLAWLSGCEVMMDTLSSAMIYMEGIWDGMMTYLAKKMDVSDFSKNWIVLEGAFDTVATNIFGTFSWLWGNIAGGLDVAISAMMGAIEELVFKFREAKATITPGFGRQARFDQIQKEREEAAAKRAAGLKARADARQADIDAGTDTSGLEARRRARQGQIDAYDDVPNILDEDYERRAKERQSALDQLGEEDPGVTAQRKELEALLKKSNDRKGLAVSVRAAALEESASGLDPRGGMNTTDTKLPSANLRGSSGAASTIAKAVRGTSNNNPELVEAKQSNVHLKNACDYLKTIKGQSAVEVKEYA